MRVHITIVLPRSRVLVFIYVIIIIKILINFLLSLYLIKSFFTLRNCYYIIYYIARIRDIL